MTWTDSETACRRCGRKLRGWYVTELCDRCLDYELALLRAKRHPRAAAAVPPPTVPRTADAA